MKSGSHSSPSCGFQGSHSGVQVCAVEQESLPTEQSHGPSNMLWKDAHLGTGTEENGNIFGMVRLGGGEAPPGVNLRSLPSFH